jgi:hypothetical protein
MWRGILIILLLALCGCTHIKLQRKTINQGSTLSEIQYQQVLDNLAMFACDPNSLAWHVKVTGGVVQVADQGTIAVVPAAVGSAQLAPNLAAGRNVLEQWNVDTVIESDDLELLHLAYQKAVNPNDADGEIKKRVYEKICELSSLHHIVLSRDVASAMIAALKSGESPDKSDKLTKIEARLAPFYNRLDELAQQNVESEPHATSAPAAPPNHSDLTATKQEIFRLTSSVCNQPFIVGDMRERPQHNLVLLEQTEGKIKALVDLVADEPDEPNQFSIPWIGCGAKKDVPRCACYVGHYRGCKGDCYVWVMPDRAKTLRDFTLVILSLVPPAAQDVSMPRLGVGAAFSPGL